MKRKTDIIISVIAIILIMTGVLIYKGHFRPFSTSSEWKYEKIVVKNEHDYNANPDVIQLKDGCWRMYTHGNRKGVDENNIYSFHSCDGLNWEFEGMRLGRTTIPAVGTVERITGGAMPAAVTLDDGRIRIYFQGSLKEYEKEGKQMMSSAISEDGLNFEVEGAPRLITDEGSLKGIKAMAHFEIVKLDRGYRVYFDESELTPKDFERYKDENWNWPVWRIRSAYSEDGLNWTLEPGIRIDYEQEPLTYMQRGASCTIIKQGDEYHMYFSAGFSPWEDLKPTKRWEWSGVYLATSKDGLNFDIIDKRVLKCGDPKIVKADEKLRIYCSTSPWLAKSRIGVKIYRQFSGKENNYIYTYVKKIKD